MFKDEVTPGVANILQELSATEVTNLVLIKKGCQILALYPRMRDVPAETRNEACEDHHHSRSNLVFK